MLAMGGTRVREGSSESSLKMCIMKKLCTGFKLFKNELILTPFFYEFFEVFLDKVFSIGGIELSSDTRDMDISEVALLLIVIVGPE